MRITTCDGGGVKLQLDVPPGENPRTIQQLVGVGRVRWTGQRFEIP